MYDSVWIIVLDLLSVRPIETKVSWEDDSPQLQVFYLPEA